ncbi:MAG: hypothetical protein JWO80_4393 [Bryobacterales bacterium]|nr:hypothetical protein [Bryobacterales bacterium]
MAKKLRISLPYVRLMVTIGIGGALSTTAQTVTEGGPRCTCVDGRNVQAGVVSYNQNSDRETITRVEPELSNPAGRCGAVWIGSTEIRPIGTPYDFHLERTAVRERRIYGCDYPTERFSSRTKTYQFAFDTNSVPIRETGNLPPPGSPRTLDADPKSKSNGNLWNSIAEIPAEAKGNRKTPSQIDSTREFNRTSWILARTEIKAHYVAIVKDGYQRERLVPLKKTRAVKAGELGQIEAVSAGRAIVRFYEGSRTGEGRGTGKVTGAVNSLRRWYDRTGGPYRETDDVLYTPRRASILEVSLDDIIEVNDYLDQKQRDRT